MTPGEFYSITSLQLFRLCFRWQAENPPDIDAVAITKRVNELAAVRGEQPVVPFYLFKGIPRGGR